MCCMLSVEFIVDCLVKLSLGSSYSFLASFVLVSLFSFSYWQVSINFLLISLLLPVGLLIVPTILPVF